MLHRQTPRAQRYDYASGGGYFVTICTTGRQHYFGEIGRDDSSGRPPFIQLNDLWNIINQQIKSLSEKRPTIDIHEYIIMPNHIHLLLIMYELRRDDSSGRPLDSNNIIQGHAEIVSLQTKQPPRPKYWSLWYIVNQFKWWCTREINKQSAQWTMTIPFVNTFARQPRYHDHIIRNEDSYNKIRYYIQTNPQNREDDTFNK